MYIYLENLSETEVPAEQGDICRCGDQILFIVHMHVGNTIYIQGYPTLGELKLNASYSGERHKLWSRSSSAGAICLDITGRRNQMAVHPGSSRKATLISGYSLAHMEESMAPSHLVLFCFLVTSTTVTMQERINRPTALQIPHGRGSREILRTRWQGRARRDSGRNCVAGAKVHELHLHSGRHK